ncbi:Fic family protein [Adhaeribacter aquaticus]|uniref:Fic family protein n=1 Tax=Adhaeribacter aquaticus TaxID=299567 RepID=UPI000A04BB4D|nr:Fic family protein [Adhaeribacter aquaticus]
MIRPECFPGTASSEPAFHLRLPDPAFPAPLLPALPSSPYPCYLVFVINNLSIINLRTNQNANIRAIQHYQFESIHPFYDGNGRTGRILNVLYLILHHQLELPIIFLSGYIIAHKGTYYRLLQEVRTKGSWEEWILFMLQATETTARQTIEQIKAIHQLFDEIQTKVKQDASKIYSKDLIEQLFIHPYTKIEYIASGLGMERKAASRYLKTLQEIGVLTLKQIGKENIYINESLYKLLKM